MSLPLGVILAGGRARRMGGRDKPTRLLAGRPLIAHVIARLAPQTDGFAIIAPATLPGFAASDAPIVPDPPEFAGQGPLAGVLAGLDFALARGHRAIVTAPADTPFLPQDLVRGLRAAAYAKSTGTETTGPAYAETRYAAARAAQSASPDAPESNPQNAPEKDPERYAAHPVCALWPVALRDALHRALVAGQNGVGAFLDAAGAARIAFPEAGLDPFFNINTDADLVRAAAMLQGRAL
ncbi:MAG: NTP transferase domain-containing protein [Pseudomonadota bacterium]